MKGHTLMAWMGGKNTILKEEDNVSRTSGGLITLLVELIIWRWAKGILPENVPCTTTFSSSFAF